jgi:hypothetical protein
MSEPLNMILLRFKTETREPAGTAAAQSLGFERNQRSCGHVDTSYGELLCRNGQSDSLTFLATPQLALY